MDFAVSDRPPSSFLSNNPYIGSISAIDRDIHHVWPNAELETLVMQAAEVHIANQNKYRARMEAERLEVTEMLFKLAKVAVECNCNFNDVDAREELMNWRRQLILGELAISVYAKRCLNAFYQISKTRIELCIHGNVRTMEGDLQPIYECLDCGLVGHPPKSISFT